MKSCNQKLLLTKAEFDQKIRGALVIAYKQAVSERTKKAIADAKQRKYENANH